MNVLPSLTMNQCSKMATMNPEKLLVCSDDIVCVNGENGTPIQRSFNENLSLFALVPLRVLKHDMLDEHITLGKSENKNC